MSNVCTNPACYRPTTGSFCPECGSKALPAGACSLCGQIGEGNFCDKDGQKRLRILAVQNLEVEEITETLSVPCGAEAGRLARFVGNANVEEEITLSPPTKGPEWNITFINLPAVNGQPVELSINGKVVYRNAGIHNRVNCNFTTPAPKTWAQTNQFCLKIPVVNFVLNKVYRIDEGLHVRFQADDFGTMKVRRQHNPF
eukprot:TRINITY_DN965_c0_g1_i7.p1 TRINITY_DN965_c0_g1~~TRINITY_DN965_c0_g1_i7.p1  ORF type:complete len:199 (-),score=20.35 TRINITY_DN965_c0_g1_i7:50-646(-)